MKTKAQKISAITAALCAYPPHPPKAQVRSTLTQTLTEMDLAILHGIAGVHVHARAARMPDKWVRLIHSDLLDAFLSLSVAARLTTPHPDRN